MGDLLTKPYTTSEPHLFILPGGSTSADNPDVMRGEETQIFGAASKGNQGLFCLPGTHSIWATFEKATFRSFKTYVTEELYTLARQYSLFGQLTEDSEPDLAAFSSGVIAAKSMLPLLNLMFHARSRVLVGTLSEAQSTWFLSGALIGHEVLSANPEHLSVTLIADGLLLSLYAAELGALDYRFSSASAEDCTTSALFRAIQSQIEENDDERRPRRHLSLPADWRSIWRRSGKRAWHVRGIGGYQFQSSSTRQGQPRFRRYRLTATGRSAIWTVSFAMNRHPIFS